MRIILVYPLIMLLSMSTTSAQVSEEMQAADMTSADFSDFPELVSIDDLAFKILAPFVLDEALYITHADGGYRRLQPVVEGLSSTHYYSGKSPLTFFRKGVDEEGEEIFLPVGACAFPINSRDIVVCLQQRDGSYGAFPIDLSVNAQPLGSVRFVNFTPANLVVLLGEERAAIDPGKDVVTKFDTSKKTYFNFKVGAMYEQEAKMVFSNRYPFRGEMRILFIGYATRISDGTQSPFRVVTHYDRGPETRPFIAE